MVYQLPALTKVTGFCTRPRNNLNEIVKYEGKLGHYFLGKKTATDISDLAPEVCQRRLVLKRLRQASETKKKFAVITAKKQTVHNAYFVYSALTRIVWTYAFTYNVQTGAYMNFDIYRNCRVVLLCFPLDDTKTDEQNLSCFFFQRTSGTLLSLAGGKP